MRSLNRLPTSVGLILAALVLGGCAVFQGPAMMVETETRPDGTVVERSAPAMLMLERERMQHAQRVVSEFQWPTDPEAQRVLAYAMGFEKDPLGIAGGSSIAAYEAEKVRAQAQIVGAGISTITTLGVAYTVSSAFKTLARSPSQGDTYNTRFGGDGSISGGDGDIAASSSVSLEGSYVNIGPGNLAAEGSVQQLGNFGDGSMFGDARAVTLQPSGGEGGIDFGRFGSSNTRAGLLR